MAVAVTALALVWQVTVILFVVQRARLTVGLNAARPHILLFTLIGWHSIPWVATCAWAARCFPSNLWSTGVGLLASSALLGAFSRGGILGQVTFRPAADITIPADLRANRNAASAVVVIHLTTSHANACDHTAVIGAQVALANGVGVAVARRRVGLLLTIIAAANDGASARGAFVTQVAVATASRVLTVCLMVCGAKLIAGLRVGASAVDADARKAIAAAAALLSCEAWTIPAVAVDSRVSAYALLVPTAPVTTAVAVIAAVAPVALTASRSRTADSTTTTARGRGASTRTATSNGSESVRSTTATSSASPASAAIAAAAVVSARATTCAALRHRDTSPLDAGKSRAAGVAAKTGCTTKRRAYLASLQELVGRFNPRRTPVI